MMMSAGADDSKLSQYWILFGYLIVLYFQGKMMVMHDWDTLIYVKAALPSPNVSLF